MIVFSAELLKKIYEHAKDRYPNECCGILLGENRDEGCRVVKTVYQAHNAADEKMRKTHFVIPTEEILYAEFIAAKHAYEIIGFYHSHIDCKAVASEEDSNFAIPGISYPIISVTEGRIEEMFSWEMVWGHDYEGFKKERIEIRN